MRAAVLRAHGEPPTYAEHPDPAVREGQALVRVTAAPVVPLDLLCASGTSYFGSRALPYVPGVQGVGEVVESTVVPAGSRVFVSATAGMADGDGTQAELVAVPEEDAVPLGEESAPLPDAAVAAVGLSGVAAWGALRLRAGLRPGERVLVLGAGGAVGQAAIGAARALGAARVVAVCRAGDAERRARACGADAVAVLPAEQDPAALAATLLESLGGEADVVVDPVFGWVAEAAARACATGGRLVNLGGSAGDTATFSSALLRGRSLSLLGWTNNSLDPAARAEVLRTVLGHAAAGRITVEHQVRPLAEAAPAWRELMSGTTYRRQVLVP